MIRTAVLALVLAACGRSQGIPDQDLGGLVVETKKPEAPIDVDRAAKDTAELGRAHRADCREAGATRTRRRADRSRCDPGRRAVGRKIERRGSLDARWAPGDLTPIRLSSLTVTTRVPGLNATRPSGSLDHGAERRSRGATATTRAKLRTGVDLPLRLDARISLDFTDAARWDAESGRLRDLVHAPPPAPEPIACPYPGMRAFAAADVGRFFGRDAEVDDLVGRLDRGERAIYVIGPSGSGKSSLVQAGLLPVIEAGSSRLGRTFVARTMRLGERPAERLAQAINGDLATPVHAIEAFVARHPPAERALVVIDQVASRNRELEMEKMKAYYFERGIEVITLTDKDLADPDLLFSLVARYLGPSPKAKKQQADGAAQESFLRHHTIVRLPT